MERRYGDRSVELNVVSRGLTENGIRLNYESDWVYKKQNCFPHSEDPPKVKGPTAVNINLALTRR